MRILLAAFVALFPIISAAVEPPTRKAGLWEIKMTHAGGGAQVIKQCVDSKTDANMLEMGGNAGAQMGMACSKKDLKKEGNGYVVETNCAVAGSRVTTKTVISGDFNSAYKAETSITQDPPLMGNAVTKMSQSAKWLGPCARGQEPGDIIMPNGMKMNMAQMESLAKMAPGLKK